MDIWHPVSSPMEANQLPAHYKLLFQTQAQRTKVASEPHAKPNSPKHILTLLSSPIAEL